MISANSHIAASRETILLSIEENKVKINTGGNAKDRRRNRRFLTGLIPGWKMSTEERKRHDR